MTRSGRGRAVSDILGPARQQVNHGTITLLRNGDSEPMIKMNNILVRKQFYNQMWVLFSLTHSVQIYTSSHQARRYLHDSHYIIDVRGGVTCSALRVKCSIDSRVKSVIVGGSDNKTPKRLQMTITALWCQDKSQ